MFRMLIYGVVRYHASNRYIVEGLYELTKSCWLAFVPKDIIKVYSPKLGKPYD